MDDTRQQTFESLIYDTDTETVHPPGKPDEFVARACPSVGALFARAPELEAEVKDLTAQRNRLAIEKYYAVNALDVFGYRPCSVCETTMTDPCHQCQGVGYESRANT